MKLHRPLFSIITSLAFFVVSSNTFAQTNNWTGATDNNWNTPTNWSLGIIPTATHDVMVPDGSTITVNANATVHSIQTTDSVTINLDNDLYVATTALFSSATTINWSSTLKGGGVISNYGTINLTYHSYIKDSTTLKNYGTFNLTTPNRDLYLDKGHFINESSGTIDFKANNANISYYNSSNLHKLTNYGTIKKTAGTSSIIAELLNQDGTFDIQAGELIIQTGSGYQAILTGGQYNVSSGAVLRWKNNVVLKDTLSGNISGDLIWNDNVVIPSGDSAIVDFQSGFQYQGTLKGGGTLINTGVIDLTYTSYIKDSTTLKNYGTFNLTTAYRPLYLNEGHFINESSGIIDFKANNANISYYYYSNLVKLTNFGTIKNTAGTSSISAELLNQDGTFDIQAGELIIQTGAGYQAILTGGQYNVSSGAVMRWKNDVVLKDTLTGNISGDLIWNDNVVIPTGDSAIVDFQSGFQLYSGTLKGGGTLINTGVIDLTYYSYIIDSTTLKNFGTLNLSTAYRHLFLNEGHFINESTGTIDFKVNNTNITYNSSNLHKLTNYGTIKNTAGTSRVYVNTDNSGQISIPGGELEFTSNGYFNNFSTAVISGKGTLNLPPSSKYNFNGLFSLGYDTLTIKEALTMDPGSDIDLKIGSPGHGMMRVLGAATVYGDLTIFLEGPLSVNDEIPIIVADGDITNNLAFNTQATYLNQKYQFEVNHIDNTKDSIILKVIGITPASSTGWVFNEVCSASSTMVDSTVMPGANQYGLDSTVITLTSLKSAIKNDYLIGYWDFSGDANDRSGWDNNGTLTGGSFVNDRYGNMASSCAFNGTSDYITVSHKKSFNLPENNFSAILLVYPANLTSSDSPLFSKSSNTDYGTYSLKVNNATSTLKYRGRSYNFNYSPPTGTWTHLGVSLNGGFARLFADGSQVDSSAQVSTYAYIDTLDFSIAKDPYGTATFFDGKMDDIRLYARALSAEEMRQAYYENKTGNPAIYTPDTLLDYGELTVGHTLYKTGHFTNTTCNDIPVSSMTTTQSAFSIQGSFTDIKAYQTLEVKTGFSPNAVAPYAADLNITTPQGNESIALQGIGCSLCACPTRNYTINTQSGINDYLAEFGGCDSLWVDLHIEGNDISDLSGFSTLKISSGNIIIKNNPSLPNLTGFQSLEKIYGDLDIYNNDALTGLDSLKNLTYLGGHLKIQYNDALTSLTGLDSLSTIGSDLVIQNNPQLSSCSTACPIINSGNIGGSLYISGNPSECSSVTEVSYLCTDQVCPSGDVHLYTQDEVDAFVAGHGSCDTIPGNLYIQGSTINDISGLSSIKYIDGYLDIRNTQLTSLTGLQSLDHIDGYFYLYNNDLLTSIDSLKHLTMVASSTTINYNDLLPNIDAMAQWDSIGSYLQVINNGMLTDCGGICALIDSMKINGTVTIYGNPSPCSSFSEVQINCNASGCPNGNYTLSNQTEVDAFTGVFSTCDTLKGNLTINGGNHITDLSGLDFLKYISGDLVVKYNTNMTDMSGFDSLTYVGGDFRIENNANLSNLNNLASLDSIGGIFKIYNNDALTDIQDLDSLKYIGSHLYVQYNNLLVNGLPLCHLLDSGLQGNYYVNGNPSPNDLSDHFAAVCNYGSLITKVSFDQIPTWINEGDTLTLKLALDYAPVDTTTVYIHSSKPQDIPLDISANFLPDSLYTTISIVLPDDQTPEKYKDITLTVGAEFLDGDSKTIQLRDDDIPSIRLEITQDTVSEGSGLYSTSAKVIRNDNYDGVLNVFLTSDDPSSIIIPAGIGLNIGQDEATFYIGINENSMVDGYRKNKITARYRIPSCNCTSPNGSPGVALDSFFIADNDGATLTLLLDKLSMEEGQSNAATLTISHNTTTSQPVTVNLSVSDSTEMSLPTTVTIPAGQNSIQVGVQTLADTLEDGNIEVTITASSMGFVSGVTWGIVSDINKPDLIISSLEAIHDSIIKGHHVTFKVTLVNKGLSSSATGIPLTGYLSEDPFLDDDDFVIGDYQLDLSLAAGDTLVYAGLGIVPSFPSTYHLIFKVNPQGSLTELLYTNNISPADSVFILPDVSANAIVDDSIFIVGQHIPVYGSVFDLQGNKLPHSPLELDIVSGNISQKIELTSDENGDFNYTFTPLEGSYGHYTIGAGYQGYTNIPTQDQFDVLGVELNGGNFITWDVFVGDTIHASMLVKNVTNIPLTNITLKPVDLNNRNVLVFDTLASLAPNTLGTLSYTLVANSISTPGAYEITLLDVYANGTKLYAEKSYYFGRTKVGKLVSSKAAINTKINKNNPQVLEFELTNQGMGTTGIIDISIPDVSWMSLVSMEHIDSLSENESSTVSLKFKPTDDLPLNTPATGTIVINAENAPSLVIPFRVEKVSDVKGNITIDVIDQYTVFTDEAPHLAGANVKITHYFTGQVFAQGITDSLGHFQADSLPEGLLRIVVSAQKHATYDNTLEIYPGENETKTVFLDYQAISFSWDVVPTTIEDEYDVELVMKFETNVPVPVIVMDMPEELPQLTGSETYPFYITLTNQGLITADDVKLLLPEDPEYEFVTSYIPQNILAQQTIQIPVVMKRRVAPKPNRNLNQILDETASYLGADNAILRNMAANQDDPNCFDVFYTSYTYECIEQRYVVTGTSVTYLGRVCLPTGTPTISNNSGPHGPPAPGGGGGGGGGNLGSGNSSISGTTSDDDCDKCANALLDALIGCIPGLGDIISGVKCGSSLVAGSWGDAANDCFDFAAGLFLDAIGELTGLKLLGCLYNMARAAQQCGLTSFPPDFSSYTIAHGAVTRDLNNLSFEEELLNDLFAFIDAKRLMQNIYFEYYDTTLISNEYFTAIHQEFKPFLVPSLSIGSADSIMILQNLADYDIPQTMLSDFIHRWNTTKEAWNANVLSPNATYPDIVDSLLLKGYQDSLTMISNYITNRGFASPQHMAVDVQQRANQYIEQQENQSGSVCASVTIKISQKLTMTREAFEGTLTVFNGHESIAMDSIKLDLIITDINDIVSNDLFEIETTEVNVMTGIDGTGMLAPQMEGVAKILFIPEPGAAPTLPKFYTFGGTLSYKDPYSGLIVTMPLTPVTLQVNPSPDLYLHYFLDRDVFGDDPLTLNVVEPTLPATLAVMIENNGYGKAMDVKIESAQPEIVDNEKGLAIDLQLIGSKLQGKEENLGLTNIDFGDIDSLSTKIGEWYFTSSLLGHFTGFSASVRHLDSRGNPDLSLVSGAELHEMIHRITVYGPLNDSIGDFLVNESPDIFDYPDAIYLSQGNTVYPVSLAESGSFDGPPMYPAYTNTLTVDPSLSEWNYFTIDDPSDGQFEIVSVTRNSDGQQIPLENVWQTYVYIPDGADPIYENKFHIVDDFATPNPETYSIIWTPKDPSSLFVKEINGVPEGLLTYPLQTLTVKFSEPIDTTTFTFDDIELKRQNGPNLIDANAVITKMDSITFDVDISPYTDSTGYYVFTANAIDVKNTHGTPGSNGYQVAWSQGLNGPVVFDFVNITDGQKFGDLDTILIKFNMAIDSSTFTQSDIVIKKNGIVQSGTLNIQALDINMDYFQVTGISSFITGDGYYDFIVDNSGINSTLSVAGFSTQKISFHILNGGPTLMAIDTFYTGGLDSKHIPGALIIFDRSIAAVDTLGISLYKNGVRQHDSLLTVTGYLTDTLMVKWGNVTFPEATYKIVVDGGKIKDLSDTYGLSSDSLTWNVTRTSSLTITNIGINPDLGISATDGITSMSSVSLLFDINEAATQIEVSYKDGINNILLGQSPASPPGQVSIPIVIPLGGSANLEISMNDANDIRSSAIFPIFLDETYLSGTWDLSNDTVRTYHPDSLIFHLTDPVLSTTIPDSSITLLKGNVKVSNPNLHFVEINDTTYAFIGLQYLDTIPGMYRAEIDLSYFEKKSSGLKGSDVVGVNWQLLDTNNPPVCYTGPDIIATDLGALQLDASQSYDIDGDSISLSWLSLEGIPMSDTTSATPVINITQDHIGKLLSFLLVVSDGQKTCSDIARVFVELDDITILTKVFLQGCYNTSTGMMHDSLRIAGLIPLTTPYTDTILYPKGNNGETIQPSVLQVSGPNAIVDWVYVEVRDFTTDSIVSGGSFLLQRDGDIVNTDGESIVVFNDLMDGDYQIVINHRNHLPVHTSDIVTIRLNELKDLDLTQNINLLLGTYNAMKETSGVFTMFSGDIDHNGQIQNKDIIHLRQVINNTGYLDDDINLNGTVEMNELNNVLLQNLGRGKQFDNE